MDKKFKNYYLAKSNPQETIQQHTDKLLKNLDILKNLYPNLFLNWDISYMLELACLYHDIGKINISFQKRVMGGKEPQIVPHGLYSLCFLEADDLCDKIYDKYLELEKDENTAEEQAINFVTVVANAIAYHHERDIPNEVSEIIKNNLESLREQLKEFKYDKIKISKVEEIAPDFFRIGTRLMPSKIKNQNEVFKKYILVKGLLNRIDYASSAGEEIQVERKNDFLLEKLENMLENWRKKNPQSDWNELQKYMIEKRDKNVITIAQTGMGKTEAGLLWIGDTKGFFILPLKTAINSIYNRVTTEIVKEKIEDRVGLLHSETKDIYLKDFSDNDLEVYYESTKQLSLPLTICTLDQIFDFVYRYKGFEPKLATLSYSKIVLDEIQMYSPDLLAYIIKGLKYITELGGKFAILTATFPEIVKDLLFNQGVEFEVSENFTKPELNLRHNVKIIEKLIDTDFILSKFQKNKILVICNTVKEAQRIYTELKEKISDKKLINLFHSKFIKRDRAIKESEILKLGNKNNKDFGIWIATQVVEASLNIDFDILITELSDLSGLFQRMGRCYRNRPLLDDETNCFVFTGDEKVKNTGVGFVVDKDIYTKSKDLILEKIDGNLFEEEKIKYISELYTTENLKETKYYKKVLDTLKYLDLINPYEQDAKIKFRDITSYMIIPKNLYEENSEEINKNLEILKQENISKKEKLTSKMKIRDLTLNIQGYELKTKSINLKSIKLGKYEEIYILDCDYSFETGFIPNTTEKVSKLIDERFL
jgi:CRISPR-associated endonuclease/helicase Cas3